MKKQFMGILLTLCMALTLLPQAALAANKLADGWYDIRCMNNYLNMTASGDAELKKSYVFGTSLQSFYVESVGDGQVTLKTQDGRYLGLGGISQGARVKAVSSPYVWNIYTENNADIFSLRPSANTKMVVNASGQKNADGTHIIIWTHPGMNAPNHAEFRFVPTTTPQIETGPVSPDETWTVFTENGLQGYKDAAGNTVIPAQFDRANKFSQGVAQVRSSYKGVAAYIDTTGKLITPYKYHLASDGAVREGMLAVATYGDEVTNAINNGDGVDSVSGDGIVDIVTMKSGKKFNYVLKCGFIDTTGKEVIPTQYDLVGYFSDGLAPVYQFQRMVQGLEIYKVGWVDKTGRLAIPYMSDDNSSNDGSPLQFEDGLACYFVLRNNPSEYPSGGIIDKTGKIIIPADKNGWIESDNFGLQWKDGIIAVTVCKAVNAQGVPTVGAGGNWSFSAIYDYSGNLIKNLDGYVYAWPISGGYTIALHQLPSDVGNLYWSLFDRTGAVVLDQIEKGNRDLLNRRVVIENGYLYINQNRYEIPMTSIPTPPSAPADTLTAVPTNTKFMLNGAEVALPAYAISGNNYVKLRDVGALLKTRFDVRWENGKAKLYNHVAYTKTSGELAAIGKDSKSATLSTTDFVWGDTGAAVSGLTAYTIGGNNYIKLRDIAKLFGFDVDWSDGKAWIEPDVSPYTED